MGQIIVTHEKHGTYYYAAGTYDEFAASALQILTERWEQGYWYHDPEASDRETQEWRPEALIENVVGELWPGWDAPLEAKQQAIVEFKLALQERYGDDEEVLAMKLKKLKVATEEYKQRARARKEYAEIKRVVEGQDASVYEWEASDGTMRTRNEPIAWKLLEDRSDHEYERVALEGLQETAR